MNKFLLEPWMKGYVLVEISGSHLEILINRLTQEKIELWDLSRRGEEKLTASVSITHFFLLKPYLKQTNSHIHVLDRFGFPFFLDKLGKRKFFVIGFFTFLTAGFSTTKREGLTFFCNLALAVSV